MANFADAFPDEVLLAALGDDIVYFPVLGGSYPIKAIVEEGVERMGNDGYTLESTTEVEVLISDLPITPKRNDKINMDGKTFTVDAITNNDGSYYRLTVH